MSDPKFVTMHTVQRQAEEVADILILATAWKLYGVPRGGIPAAMAIGMCDPRFEIVDNSGEADVIVDDIYDSGDTAARYANLHPGKIFVHLFDKRLPQWRGQWLVMPWEVTDSGTDVSSEDIVTRLLQFIGEDPNREGLLETPKRVMKAWKEWAIGYGQDPAAILKTFEDGASNYDEMVFQGRIPFYSCCEHHMAPFFGVAHIAYIPNGKILGLSKLSRLVDIFSRRLQCQERITVQIADTLNKELIPQGVGVVLQARHLCMESRGVHRTGTMTTTSALRGAIKEQPDARAEFMSFVTAAQVMNV